jgi:hypothetical protein
MRKLSALLLFAFLASLMLAIPAPAANLEAGWYARIQGIMLYTYDYLGNPTLADDGYFHQTPPGQYGPFLVTGGPDNVEYTRYISVPTGASAGPEATLDMPISFGIMPGTKIAFLSTTIGTNYSSSQMYLDLWRTQYDGTHELIWEQRLGGQQSFSGHIANDIYFEGPFHFTLNVVPEPCGVALFLGGTSLLARMWWRRKRQ